MLFSKNEIPKEMYDELLRILLSNELAYNIYDGYPPDPLDVKTILMLKNNSIFFAGRCIKLDVGIPNRDNSIDLAGITGSLKKYFEFMRSFLAYGVVRSRLSETIDMMTACEEFRGSDSLPYMYLCVTICNICECVVIGSDSRIMMHHLTSQHCKITYNPTNYYGLVDYVTEQGDCVKCRKTYEIFADNPSLMLRLKKFSNTSVNLTVGRWCKYDQTVKTIVRDHILECFCAGKIPKWVDRCLGLIMNKESKYTYIGCLCGCESNDPSSSSSSEESESSSSEESESSSSEESESSSSDESE